MLRSQAFFNSWLPRWAVPARSKYLSVCEARHRLLRASPQVSQHFQRTVNASVSECRMVKLTCLLRGETGPNEVAPCFSNYTSKRPGKIVISAGQGAFFCFSGRTTAVARETLFGLLFRGLSVTILVLGTLGFACSSGHAVFPDLTSRRTLSLSRHDSALVCRRHCRRRVKTDLLLPNPSSRKGSVLAGC